MTTYKITSSAGIDMGTYTAPSESDALDALARDAGYESQAAAMASVGLAGKKTGLHVEEVRP